MTDEQVPAHCKETTEHHNPTTDVLNYMQTHEGNMPKSQSSDSIFEAARHQKHEAPSPVSVNSCNEANIQSQVY